MTQPQTTPQEWGSSVLYTTNIKGINITINPKWWQFWKKPKTVFLQESIQETQNQMLKNIVERAFE